MEMKENHIYNNKFTYYIIQYLAEKKLPRKKRINPLIKEWTSRTHVASCQVYAHLEMNFTRFSIFLSLPTFLNPSQLTPHTATWCLQMHKDKK